MYRSTVLAVAVVFAMVVSLSVAFASTSDSTGFTYQGNLEQAGSPVTDTLQMRFRLYNSAIAGTQIGTEQIEPFVEVVDGQFTVVLDFGAEVTANLWLEIEVEGVTLAPRQVITGVPYSISTRGISVDDDGNVGIGIGTDDPAAQLDVRQQMAVTNTTGDIRVNNVFDTVNNVGAIETYGPNGFLNFQAWFSGSANNGAAIVVDQFGNIDAGMIASATGGQSSVFANIKNFRMPNPREAGTEIVYACVEGPEAAAYLRGTALLVDGEAFVPFPEHFMDVASIADMTVQLTPRSADSLGLAVVEQLPGGFRVKELMRGTGTYEFNWHATAVRRGYENYQIIQPALRLQQAQPVARPAASPRPGDAADVDAQQFDPR